MVARRSGAMFCVATTSADRQFGVDRAESPVVWGLRACGQVMCGASGAGASPGDGVFVPVSSVYLLTRPNRMTVSLGTRVGTTTTHRTSCPFRSLQRTRSADMCDAPSSSRATHGAPAPSRKGDQLLTSPDKPEIGRPPRWTSGARASGRASRSRGPRRGPCRPGLRRRPRGRCPAASTARADADASAPPAWPCASGPPCG
jgi:hypothetical protein